MLIRVLLSSIFQYYLQIICIDPNLGNEMGRSSGDKVSSKGNDHINAKQRIFHFTLNNLSLLLSLYFRWDDPVSLLDYIYFLVASISTIGCLWIYNFLGEYYTFTIGIRKDHWLITDGPYKHIMHPGYLCQILIISSSICFYNINSLITLLLLLYTLYIYRRRIIEEEQMLQDEFGEDFVTYKSTRFRLIPRVY